MLKNFAVANLFVAGFAVTVTAVDTVPFVMERTVAHRGFDGNMCWVHARAGAIPAGHTGSDSPNPLVVMTMQPLLLSGSDVFYALNETRSNDLGQSWTTPSPHDSFARQTFTNDRNRLPTGASIAPDLLQAGDQTTVCDFTPKWHAASQRLLGIGQTVWYRDNRVLEHRPRGIAYAVYDVGQKRWEDWRTIELPELRQFQSAGSGSAQRVDLVGGDVLIPFYFKDPVAKQYSVAICRCRFDGRTLDYIDHGNELTVPIKRGLYEPSLTKFRDRYYLTMRNDDHGYVSTSDDGLNYSDPQRWTFDDGSDLGNYNTQQHWVTHQDGLFLVYTRRGADNDHVFRHRAPLFIAQVDPDKLNVIRQSEQILVSQRGARLGNFGVVDVSPDETWITASEWMQPRGVEEHGSDNSIHVVKLKWNRPKRFSNESTPSQTLLGYFTPPAKWRGDLGSYRSPLLFADGTKARSADDWQRRRAEIKGEWQNLLGHWPPLNTEPVVEVLDTEDLGAITKHRIRFAWTPSENTTGYLLVPKIPGRHPAVVTAFYEPETAVGKGKLHRDFALQLANRGFVALSIGTTEASAQETYSLYYPSIDDATVAPLSMLACAAANAWHVLANRPEVDKNRIGIVGHSFGGKWAMFAACLFDGFVCSVWSDPGIVFDDTRSSVNYWEPWYLGYHAKPWRPRGMISPENPARGLYPRLRREGRDLHELHALMAPRPFLVSGGSEDSPDRWRALNHSIEVNKILGYENRIAMTNRPDHSPNEDSNTVIYAFFEHFLGGE